MIRDVMFMFMGILTKKVLLKKLCTQISFLVYKQNQFCFYIIPSTLAMNLRVCIVYEITSTTN